jgi:hypothetical protein
MYCSLLNCLYNLFSFKFRKVILLLIFLTGQLFVFLQALDHAKERGAKIYAEVRGYGMSGILLFQKEDLLVLFLVCYAL